MNDKFKEKEYYEYLISLEMDGELSESQAKELEAYLKIHPELREFREKVRLQAQSVRQLPTIEASGELSATSEISPSSNWLTSLLRYRVKIPLPAAAVILLLLIGSLSFNFRGKEPQPPDRTINLAETSQSQNKYVREIKLKPVQAEIVPSGNDKTKKENSI